MADAAAFKCFVARMLVANSALSAAARMLVATDASIASVASMLVAIVVSIALLLGCWLPILP